MVKFKYVVARPWYPEKGDSPLCIYSFGNEIQEGDMKSAKKFLDYVRRQEPDMAEHYGIYTVAMTKIHA